MTTAQVIIIFWMWDTLPYIGGPGVRREDGADVTAQGKTELGPILPNYRTLDGYTLCKNWSAKIN